VTGRSVLHISFIRDSGFPAAARVCHLLRAAFLCDEVTMETEFAFHPAAGIFPMLPEDKLRELAEDIQKNGQRESQFYFSKGKC